MDKLMNKFVRLNNNVSIHKFPDGGFIFRKLLQNEGEKVKTHVDMEFINNSAKIFFSLADGRKRIYEIFNDMYGDKWRVYKKYLLEFVRSAHSKNDIILLEESDPREIKVTGSDKHFFPLHVSIELTYLCQLKCAHCYANSGSFREKIFLKYEKLRKFLKTLAEKGLKVIELTGGEPLLYPKFKELMEFSYQHFDTIALLTNGYAINEDIAKFLSNFREKLIVNISLDASIPELHDTFRGVKGSFTRAKKAIQLLSKKGVFVRVTMSVYPDFLNEIEPTLLLARKLGAKSFVWNPVLPFGRGRDLVNDTNETVSSRFDKISEELLQKYKDFIQWFPSNEIDKMMIPVNCGAGWRSVVIDPYGNIRPCLYMTVNQINLGNVYRSTIDEIFSNEVLYKLYNLVPPRKEICGDCSNLPFCNNCIARGLAKASKIKECKWAKNQNITEIFSVNRGNT